MSIVAICLVAGAMHARIEASSFTLKWQHSVEKILWEEDYEIAGPWLHLSKARIRGNGAGMEVPDGALLVRGVYHYRPTQRWSQVLNLARSEFVADYQLCINDDCQPLSKWIPVSAGVTTLAPCPAS